MEKKSKVLINSHFFYPALGGLETVSLALANGFIANGFECKVITKSINTDADDFPFEVIRNPDTKQQISLVKWADIILFNGASMALQPWVLLYRKPFLWVHQGYQVLCIDGLGWVDGKKAPIKPISSIIFHSKLKGLKWGLKQGSKLLVRRFVAKHLVTQNIAITQWVDKLQPLPRQIQIYNPFPTQQFITATPVEPEYDFLYLGRLVSEKGISTLLRAFASVLEQTGHPYQLLIIGDGQWRGKMEQLAADLNIAANINFAGKKWGADLVNYVAKGRIAVIPSEWYEPMGGVALELMAAGKSLIVANDGGLKECVGDTGLTFPNGNSAELAKCMITLLQNDVLRQSQLLKAKERIKQFDSDLFIAKYINVVHQIIAKRQ